MTFISSINPCSVHILYSIQVKFVGSRKRERGDNIGSPVLTFPTPFAIHLILCGDCGSPSIASQLKSYRKNACIKNSSQLSQKKTTFAEMLNFTIDFICSSFFFRFQVLDLSSRTARHIAEPSPLPILIPLGSKYSSQDPLCDVFEQRRFSQCEVVSLTPNPPCWRTIYDRLSTTAYSIYSQLTSISGGLLPPPIRNLEGRAMPG